MKKTISDLLEKYVDVFGFVSIKEYLAKRSSNGKEDSFSRIPEFNKYKTIIVLGLSYPSKIKPYHFLSWYC